MKKLVVYTAFALGTIFTSPPMLNAQDPTPRQRLQRQDASANVDSKTSGATMRVSQLTGMDIQNPRGEDIGEIKDLVVDAKSGRVLYAAVSYGGFLGIGDELFAVPFEAFKFRSEADDADDVLLVLDVSKEQLEGAKGFDQDNWPNFADKNFTDDLDRRYKIQRRRQGGGADVNVELRSDQDR